VSTQEGTILKEILVDFLTLLNKKRYRHGLIFSVSDHIYISLKDSWLMIERVSVHLYDKIL
jgi:hypothetical protein